MFAYPVTSLTPNLKNLSKVSFSEKDDVEKIIDQLAKSAKDPYIASLPMMMSAQLGDQKRYDETRRIFLSELNTSAHYQEWMQKSIHSFKAWMWGRALLAADNMNDEKNINEAQKELSTFLVSGKKDNLAFYTWAEGYSAALNKKEFSREAKAMLSNTDQLIAERKANQSSHDALSNALWACVMALQAAANAQDQETYQQIKEKIVSLDGSKSISSVLNNGLLRNVSTNDYPAWAMAIVRKSAAIIGDKELCFDLNDVLTISIAGAKAAEAKAEYALAVLENQLALEIGKQIEINSRKLPAAGQ